MSKGEIDDIFSSKKKKKKEPVAVTTAPAATEKRRDAKKPYVQEDSLFTDLKGSKGRKRTEEGFRVYNDEELKIDPKAGTTDACPFDCECPYPCIIIIVL